MVKFNLSYALVLATLVLAALFQIEKPSSFNLETEQSDFFEAFPVNIDGWMGTETPVDKRTYEILETKNVLSRLYQDPGGAKVYLLLVASKKDRRVAHPPEVCYLSSNYEILDKRTYTIEPSTQESIPVNAFVARNERRPEEQQKVIYLYKVGERYTTNYYAQQLRFAVDHLSGKSSEVYLIRLAGDDEKALELFLPKVLKILEKSDFMQDAVSPSMPV